MTDNPFDDPDGTFHVLTNDELQHSLWPATIPVPDGWIVALRGVCRNEAVEYVNTHWTDIRPASLLIGCQGPANSGTAKRSL
ncbi:MbtH family NRPS accessory protein [Amycolatopsis mongoliensis]|uniref:MbtH family NRPS accessory protein n=2 Tax=Amycolatopsis mongoliensis TaxID=715475 RepID=A0A9Y2NKB7_9PSEU|nr:MbtH family NRPS accessory protein [Amycolatopsis sp. 4-36]WIY00975.1 MbtH family NRPS accessory protein [Amycolatopsis sp. 4-36]